MHGAGPAYSSVSCRHKATGVERMADSRDRP